MKRAGTSQLSSVTPAIQKRGLKLLQELIAIPTVNPPGEHYEACAKFLAESLRALGLEVSVFRVPWSEQRKTQPNYKEYPRWNVVGRLHVGAAKTLHFNAHYDVVPVSGKWRFGPFEPKVKDGWIYGRGSADMKGSIASCLMAIETIVKGGHTPTVNVEVSFTADEETGGQLGAGWIVRKGHVNADYAVVMEGGRRNFVGLGHNGVLWLEGTIKGKAAHGAWPQKGLNAFEHLCAVSGELFALRDRVAKRQFKARGIDTMNPTFNIGGVFGGGSGAKVNTVSSEAKFTLDRRLVANETMREARSEIVAATKRAKKKVPKLQLEYTTLFECDPCFSSSDIHLVKVADRVVRQVTGERAKYEICRGFTDLHYFMLEGGIDAIGYGPDGENYHGIDERSPVSKIVRAAEVYVGLICGL